MRSRLRYLSTFELLGAGIVSVIVYQSLPPPWTLPILVSLGVVVVILVQASVYRWLKLRFMSSGTDEAKRAWSRRFAVIRRVVGVRIVVAAGVACWAWITNAYRSSSEMWFTVGLVALAVAEYVNHYHWQRMYDWPADWRRLRRGLKRGRLGIDLRRGSLLWASLLPEAGSKNLEA